MGKAGKTRWVLIGLAVALAAVTGAVAFVKLRRDPARELFAGSLPAWQTARSRGVEAGGDAARALLAAAQRWPAVAAALATLDAVWPDAEQCRAAAKAVNRALVAAQLPYVVDIQRVGRTPV